MYTSTHRRPMPCIFGTLQSLTGWEMGRIGVPDPVIGYESREQVDIKPVFLGFDGKVRLGPCKLGCQEGALADYPVGGAVQACLQKRPTVRVVTGVTPQESHLFFDQGAFAPVWKHRIEVEDIWFALFEDQARQLDQAVAGEQGYSAANGGKFRILASSLESVSQERMSDWRSLAEGNRTAQGGENKTVPAQSGGGIKDSRQVSAFYADSPGQRLFSATAMGESVFKGVGGEISGNRAAPWLSDFQAVVQAETQLELIILSRPVLDSEPGFFQKAAESSGLKLAAASLVVNE